MNHFTSIPSIAALKTNIIVKVTGSTWSGILSPLKRNNHSTS
jgi:hypothetical protein